MTLPQRFTRTLRFLIPVLVLMFAGACGPPWEVLKQSDPSALVGTSAIAINWDFSNARISGDKMTEQEWLDSRKKDQDRNTYNETKEKAQDGFAKKLAEKLGAGVQISRGTAPAGGVQTNVYVDWWEEGAYIGVAAWPSQVHARVQFVKDGNSTDEIAIKCRVDANIYTPSPQQRLNRCGEILGELSAKYVSTRNGSGG